MEVEPGAVFDALTRRPGGRLARASGEVDRAEQVEPWVIPRCRLLSTFGGPGAPADGGLFAGAVAAGAERHDVHGFPFPPPGRGLGVGCGGECEQPGDGSARVVGDGLRRDRRRSDADARRRRGGLRRRLPALRGGDGGIPVEAPVGVVGGGLQAEHGGQAVGPVVDGRSQPTEFQFGEGALEQPHLGRPGTGQVGVEAPFPPGPGVGCCGPGCGDPVEQGQCGREVVVRGDPLGTARFDEVVVAGDDVQVDLLRPRGAAELDEQRGEHLPTALAGLTRDPEDPRFQRVEHDLASHVVAAQRDQRGEGDRAVLLRTLRQRGVGDRERVAEVDEPGGRRRGRIDELEADSGLVQPRRRERADASGDLTPVGSDAPQGAGQQLWPRR